MYVYVHMCITIFIEVVTEKTKFEPMLMPLKH